MGFTLITVTGRFMRPDGVTPAEGRVEFRLRTALRNTESDEIVEPQRISAVLDADGAIQQDLVATDDTDTRPTGGVWEVTERISGSRPRSYMITLSHTLPGGTLDLADAAPVTDVQLYDYALVTHGHTATAVTFTPTGPIASTNVQDAIVEAATEAAHPNLASHDALGLAMQAELDDEAADRAAGDALLIPLAQKGAADGVATLGPDSKIPTAQLPPLAINDFLGTVASQAAMLALVGQRGDWAVRTDTDPDEAWAIVGDDPTQLASWQRFGTFGGVLSVNGQTGAVVLPVDGAAGTASLRTLGNGATQAASGAALVAETTRATAAEALLLTPAQADAAYDPLGAATAAAANKVVGDPAGHKHTTTAVAPAAPAVGDVWDNPADPPFLFVRRTAAKLVNNAGVADDGVLQVAVLANAIYELIATIIYDATTTADLAIGWSGPAGATLDWVPNGPVTTVGSGTVQASTNWNPSTMADARTIGAAGIGTKLTALPSGLLVVGATAGTFKLRWGQGTPEVSDLTVYPGSRLRLLRVA